MLNIDHTVIQKDRVLTEVVWMNHEKTRGPTKDVSWNAFCELTFRKPRSTPSSSRRRSARSSTGSDAELGQYKP